MEVVIALQHHLLTVIAASMAMIAAAAGAQQSAGVPSADHKVIELRQYRLTAGSQDKFIPLFDKQFVETQEVLGMRLIGQFHDHDRPDRFTWIREFPNMTERAKMLDAFYNGPVWHQWRGIANPMLFDNDNVLLLRAAREGSGFGPSAPHPSGLEAKQGDDVVFAVIEYLWQEPGQGFADFFLDRVSPMLSKAGLSVLGVYVPEEQPNNFPRLPVRSDRKILVWFTKARNAGDFDRIRKRLMATSRWKSEIGDRLDFAEERPPQVLRLDPTPRSALR